MRTPRAISLTEIIKKTGLSRDEVRRFNPALVDRVPARGTPLPATLRQRVWRRRRVLAPPGQPFVRCRAERFPAPRTGCRTVGRSVVRPGPRGFPTPLPGDEHRRRHGDGHGPGLLDGPGRIRARAAALLAEFRNSENVRALIERGVLERDGLRSVEALRDECQSVPTPAGPPVPACQVATTRIATR